MAGQLYIPFMTHNLQELPKGRRSGGGELKIST